MREGNEVKKYTARLVGASAAGLMAAGLLVAPPAFANYAPGLPPAAPGVPNNPPAAATIVPGVVLVNETVAERTPPRTLPGAPSERIGQPTPVPVTQGAAVALVVQNAPPGSTWVVEVKRKGGRYNTLGSTVATSDGRAVLPVFRAANRGIVILALRNVQTGEVRYVKVRAQRR
jgi:hypothetical protein